MASEVATQTHNTANTSQIMGAIQSAQEAGLLSKDDASALVKQHIQSQIDGGQAQKAAIDKKKAKSKTSLQDAAVTAAKGNKSVEATTVDGDGNVSTVKIGAHRGSDSSNSSTTAGTVVLASVSPAVPAVKQKPDTPTGWAAAAAMLVSWKAGKGKALAPDDALQPAGDQYVEMWTRAQGLPMNQKDAFLKAMGMTAEPAASHVPSALAEWMKKYGPLWLTTDAAAGAGVAFSPRAKVLTQISGDAGGSDDDESGDGLTFTWIDPLDGRTKKQSFKEIGVVGSGDTPAEPLAVVVHLVDKVKKKGSAGSDARDE